MERTLPWSEGGGALHLSYNGEKNGEIVFWSDSPNNTGRTRSLEVTVYTTKGNTVFKRIKISQLSNKAYVSDDTLILTSAIEAYVTNGNLLISDTEINVKDESLIIQ